MDKPKTKEAIEYEKCLKTLHELSLKKALSEDGIDTSKVPRKKLDDIRRLVDRQQPVHHKYREIINKAQQESNAIITKANQDMQAELAGIQKEVEEVIKSIKIEQGIITAEPESPKEEVKKEPETGEPEEGEK